MNCGKFKELVDLEVSAGDFRLTEELESHINSCDSCRAYYDETVSLREVLNSQKFEIRPNELDNISFENIKSLAGADTNDTVIIKPKRFNKFIWAPVAAAAVLLLMLFVADYLPIGDNGIDNYTTEVTFDNELNIALTDGYGSEIISGLVGDDEQLDQLAGELVYDIEINTLIESLTDEELLILEEKLKHMNGSSG